MLIIPAYQLKNMSITSAVYTTQWITPNTGKESVKEISYFADKKN